MEKLFYYRFPGTPIGELGIIEEDEKITWIFFRDRENHPKHSNKIFITETALIKKTSVQLNEYFSRKRKSFDIPLLLRGTDFQLSVWQSLQKIPYGKTCSYAEIAAMAGNPKACRAAGMANNQNPAVIIIPCHRVIGSNGSLTGYGGGLEIKKYLLALEKKCN